MCTSNSSLPWNSNYKPGGTAIIALGNTSSAIIIKGEHLHGLIMWTTVTLLGKHNKRTSIFNMYRQGDTSIEKTDPTTVNKQQWLILQQKNRTNIHPRDATINDLTIAVKRKQKDYHEIIVTMDGNDSFVNTKGGISKLCKVCQLYDPLTYLHDLPTNISTYIKGTKQTYYILVSFNILKELIQCGMTAFNGLTTPDRRGFHLDLSYNKVLKQKVIEHPSPFNRKFQSNYSTSVRFYKKYLEKKVTTQKLESKVKTMLTVSQERKLTQEKNDYLKKLIIK